MGLNPLIHPRFAASLQNRFTARCSAFRARSGRHSEASADPYAPLDGHSDIPCRLAAATAGSGADFLELLGVRQILLNAYYPLIREADQIEVTDENGTVTRYEVTDVAQEIGIFTRLTAKKQV